MQSPVPYQPFSSPTWLVPKQRERVLRIPSRLAWAIIISLLLHVFLLFGFLVELMQPGGQSASVPLNIVLDLGAPVPPKPITPQEPPPSALSEPTPVPKTKPIAPPRSTPVNPKLLHSERADNLYRLPVTPPEPLKPETQAQPKPPAEDFSSMIKRKQAQNYAAELSAKRLNEEALAAERGPTEDERRMKNIMNNLKFGTNGLFSVRRMDPLNATFSFKGWTNDYTSANTQYFEVEARSGEDIRLVMIRRMIAIIREHYTGNFDWISNRLGRTITLSARQEDNAGLEDFMMKEFFGPNYKSQDIYP